jgi:phosphate transport system substrate-binding protein
MSIRKTTHIVILNLITPLIAIFLLLPGQVLALTEINDSVLTWAGCGITQKSFMKELAQGFEKETGIKIQIEGPSATRGIRDTARGLVMMGGTCRMTLPMSDSVESYVTLHPVAWDALAVILNKNNPVENITSDNISKVYSGEITNWKQLGGVDKPIHLYIREGKISGVGYAIRQYIFKEGDFNFVTSKKYIKKSSGPIEKAVEVDPEAIAITGVSSARKRDVKIIGIDDYVPTYENVKSGDYIFYRPLYLVTGAKSNKMVKDFVKFASSKKGKQIIRDNGTVPYSDAWYLMRKPLIYGDGVR